MAEFQEVVFEFHRLCENQRRLHKNTCDKCPIKIAALGTLFQCYRYVLEEPKEAENIIMQWAAEHPEPVYPTWGEWLISIGAARKIPTGIPFVLQGESVVDVNTPIPAAIAEKLGIEPKVGV